MPDPHGPYVLSHYEVEDPVVGEKGVTYIAPPGFAFRSVGMTLGERLEGYQGLFKRCVPGLGVSGVNLTVCFKPSQASDVLVDVVV